LHQPDIVIMDEATSALDPASQERLMNLAAENLPGAAIISIAHRPELEAFHHRKLVFEHRPGGSRLVSDDILAPSTLPSARRLNWLRRVGTAARREDAAVD
jgi:putative ATP-binding cassette transporter